MKRLIIALVVVAVTFSTRGAQTTEEPEGIHFEEKLNWSEILAKAKAEHKYIFVDCYATWCGPCKQMEATVYPQKQVGYMYNKDFISVKLQMDKTPADAPLTKSRYGLAESFEKDYHVYAYPTFLFFDPDGNPVHKATGALDATGFVRLAGEAQNPEKQYYAILKNFQPGKLDTTGEKGLAGAFANTDKALAAKIAADYLSRIPRSRLKDRYSVDLIQFFQDDPQVFAITLNYLRSLTNAELNEAYNSDIVTALADRQEVKAIAITHLRLLSQKELNLSGNREMMTALQGEADVQKIAENYIDGLPEAQLLNKSTLEFIDPFTKTPTDRGFQFLFDHAKRVDTIMSDADWAQARVCSVIFNSDVTPLLDSSKKTGQTPNFDQLSNQIGGKYSLYYAKRVAADARISWYGYLVNGKKDTTYWPQLLQAKIGHLHAAQPHAVANPGQVTEINNTCWEVYLHGTDKAVLNPAISYMKKLTSSFPNIAPQTIDTYACLLYKAGKTTAALKEEQQVIQWCIAHQAQGTMTMKSYTQRVIAAMQNGEPIWTERQFQ